MARRHDHRQPAARACSRRQHLHLQVVALVDDHVGAGDELARSSSSSTPRGIRDDADVGIELGDLARGQHDLAHADVGDAAGDPVEVREVEHVEVGQPQLAADALVRHRRDDRAPDRQARRRRRTAPPAARCSSARDRVAVAVEAQLAMQRLGQDVHQPAAPRIEDPRAERGRRAAFQHALDRRAHRPAALAGARPLTSCSSCAASSSTTTTRRIRHQRDERGRGVGAPRVEEHRPEGGDVAPRRRGGERRCQLVAHGRPALRPRPAGRRSRWRTPWRRRSRDAGGRREQPLGVGVEQVRAEAPSGLGLHEPSSRTSKPMSRYIASSSSGHAPRT